MLGRRFNISDSRTRSSFQFKLRQPLGENINVSFFRDPAAIPLLEKIADSLRAGGYQVTQPKPGKACHGAFHVDFPNVKIVVILLVRRIGDQIEFTILTWPSQSFRQRVRSPRPSSPDFVTDISQMTEAELQT